MKQNKFNLLILTILLGFLPTFVSAEVEKQTDTLDLTTQTTIDNLDTQGWAWDNEEKILTLKNADFEITDENENTAKPCIKFLESDNIMVIFEGTNNLIADNNSVFYGSGSGTGSLTFQSTTDGVLNLKIKNYSSIGGNNIGGTINYPYNLNIKSGTINSEGGILADGVVSISGGNLNINTEKFPSTQGLYVIRQVNITGGNIDINASSAPIMVTGLTSDTSYEDGVIIDGGNITLKTNEAGIPDIHAGALGHKNIVINGGDLTLEGGYGFYTADGIIEVNRLDSLNANKVKNDVFKVSSSNTNNKIIYADADYSKVEEAIQKAQALNKEDYVDFSAVENALASVVRGKSVLEQNEVNKMAKDIEDAIRALKKKEQNSNQEEEEDEEDDVPETGDILLIPMLEMFTIGLSSTYLVKKIRTEMQ